MPEHDLALERRPPSAGADLELALRVPSDVRLVDQAVELLVVACYGDDDSKRQHLFRMRVALTEALANAMQCGNRGDPTRLVHIEAVFFAAHIRLTVRDEGPGFDPALVPDPLEPGMLESPCGRGLFLIRNLADAVGFNDKGNEIWMTLPR